MRLHEINCHRHATLLILYLAYASKGSASRLEALDSDFELPLSSVSLADNTAIKRSSVKALPGPDTASGPAPWLLGAMGDVGVNQKQPTATFHRNVTRRRGARKTRDPFAAEPKGTLERMTNMFMALGGGTGFSVDEVDDTQMGQEIERRTIYQSSAVILLIILFYFAAILSGLSFLHWRVKNNSHVTYYADPRYHTMAVEGNDIGSFLATFNQTPKSVCLQVTGFMPGNEWTYNAVEWNGNFYSTAFTFALDLSPWCVRMASSSSLQQYGGRLEDGMTIADLGLLQDFLRCNKNDLATVDIKKEVMWPGWEELATNIKQRIRQCGFAGKVHVHYIGTEVVTVHKNRQWANFMHNQATRVLAALSLVGFPFFWVYMWLRCTRLVIRAKHRIDIDTAEFWRLIADQLSSAGFLGPVGDVS